jgi:hypothetical protein
MQEVRSVALNWTREEAILALAAYLEAGADVTGKYPDTESATAKELSATLRQLNAHSLESPDDSYRSKNSVRLKWGNF